MPRRLALLRPAQRAAFDRARHLLAQPLDSVTLREQLILEIRVGIPHEAIAVSTYDPALGLMTHSVSRDIPSDLVRDYLQYVYPTSGVQLLRDVARSGRVAVEDLTDEEAALYDGSAVGHRLAAVFSADGDPWGSWCTFRQRQQPFAEAEHAFAEALAPYMVRGLRRAALLEAAAMPGLSDTPGVLVFDARGALMMRDARAAAMLADLSRGDVVGDLEAATLLASLRTLLAERTARAAADPMLPLDACLTARGASGTWYELHAAPADDAAGHVLVVASPLAPAGRSRLLAQLYGLTERENEIVTRIARGDGTKQVAAALGLSPYTVQDHVDKACVKVGVRGRRELVARLFVDATGARQAVA